MKAAFSYRGTRIAPVFDVSRQIRVVEAVDGKAVSETDEAFADEVPAHTLGLLASLGIGTLVCGAISRPLEEMIAASGIRVVPFVAGEVPDLVEAWIHDRLDDETLAMPGCCGRRRRSHMGHAKGGRPGSGMRARGRGKGGPGGCGARPGAVCVCPRGGHAEPHRRGVPCFEVRCAKCGTAMMRKFD